LSTATASPSQTPLLSFHDTWRPRANPWVIAFTVTLATFMEALDTSIANVAMPHIAGSLSSSRDEGTWVLTSYLVANAVVLPISGWLSNRIGRKRFYMSCVALFTLSSLLCGLAPSLGFLVCLRVLQGAAGGGLQPSEQAILADTFPPAKRAMAFATYGMAVVLAPAIGPTIGGWVTDNYSWRWIFFLNIPVGIISLLLTNRLVEDPPYVTKRKKNRESVDYWGLGLLIIWVGALQIMLDKGQEDDWFSSRVIVGCFFATIIGVALFFRRELSVRHPIVDLRLFKNRNVAMTQLVMFMIGASLYATTVLIPQFLQELMGYTAASAGMAISAGGLVLMLLFPVAGYIAPRFDQRLIVSCGFLVTTLGLMRITQLNLGIGFETAISWRAVIALGLPFLFVPINVLCYADIPQNRNNEVSGLTALSRNLGGSFGISFVTTLLTRRAQIHETYLSAHLVAGSQAYATISKGMTETFEKSGLAHPDAAHHAAARIYDMLHTQARTLAYVDTAWILVALTALLIPLPFLMKRPKRGKAPVAGH
jgi:MFS transporter, DHA2 family, multidrug resistance protein